MVGRRLNLWRLREFDVTRIEAPEDVLLYECVARENPADRRLVALAQVRQLAVVRDDEGRVTGLPHAERAVENCLEAIRRTRVARGAAGSKLDMNHVWVHVWPVVEIDSDGLAALGNKIRPLTDGAGIEEVLAQGRVLGPDGDAGAGVRAVRRPARSRRGDLGRGTRRPRCSSRSTTTPPRSSGPVVAGWSTPTSWRRCSPARVARWSSTTSTTRARWCRSTDREARTRRASSPPSSPRRRRSTPRASPASCSAATRPSRSARSPRPSAARIIAALDLAERMQVPVEWFALSAGARISMDSGTENMDWVAAALRRIVEFTQDGGEINVVVAGINVGAQPYWNAEATMLMHTKGILVMTPDSAMVLTGKQSLDFSGGVSAEDNFGIGGYDRVMGPNGQAQYWAPDLAGAFGVLMAHYEHTYVAPGETGPRRAATTDPADRDISSYPHEVEGSDFTTVGEIFSADTNPERKKAFDIRTVMRAVADQDHPTLERWAGMADADTAVVQDAHIGGHSVCLLGHRVQARTPTRLPAHRRSGHLHRRHPLPAVVEEGGPGDQRGQRQPSAGGAGQPVRLRRLAGLHAQPAAGVRRRDRPRHRELPAARSCSA